MLEDVHEMYSSENAIIQIPLRIPLKLQGYRHIKHPIQDIHCLWDFFCRTREVFENPSHARGTMGVAQFPDISFLYTQ